MFESTHLLFTDLYISVVNLVAVMTVNLLCIMALRLCVYVCVCEPQGHSMQDCPKNDK